MEALLIVSVQNDFCPGGAVAVPEGDGVAPVANRLMDRFGLVVATQDWHPADHVSFAANHPGREPGEVIEAHGLEQLLWPVHCVQETPGADFHPDLDQNSIDKVIRKGMRPNVDSYSGFFDNGREQATGLGEFLAQRGVTDIALCGLATDYCVKCTALDARDLGFSVRLVEDGCRGVNQQPGDVAAALTAMQDHGVELLDSKSLR